MKNCSGPEILGHPVRIVCGARSGLLPTLIQKCPDGRNVQAIVGPWRHPALAGKFTECRDMVAIVDALRHVAGFQELHYGGDMVGFDAQDISVWE
jgi:hypothetical protein